jgi:hypothetical protein
VVSFSGAPGSVTFVNECCSLVLSTPKGLFGQPAPERTQRKKNTALEY